VKKKKLEELTKSVANVEGLIRSPILVIINIITGFVSPPQRVTHLVKSSTKADTNECQYHADKKHGRFCQSRHDKRPAGTHKKELKS
jgi:hypothetical protein